MALKALMSLYRRRKRRGSATPLTRGPLSAIKNPMGGFTNLIYFKEHLSDKAIGRITDILDESGETRQGNGLDRDIIVTHKNEGYGFRIYYSDAEGDEDFDKEDNDEFMIKLGYVPKCYIGLMAWHNSKFGQRFIAQLASEILAVEQGLFDFSAAIDPKQSNDREEIRNFTSTISGKMVELEYSTTKGDKWFTHAVDKSYLDAWRKHPLFYIPK